MKKISVGILLLVVSLFIYSCSKDDGTSAAPPRDYSEQYLADIDTIDKFIDEHYMVVDPATYDVTFHRITAGETSIRNQTAYPLQYKMVDNRDDDGEEFQYKIYYIKFAEGTENKPSRVDSVHVSYEGSRIYSKAVAEFPATDPATYDYFNEHIQFEFTQNPIWLTLDGVVTGMADIMALFKTGTYDPADGPNPVNFSGYGAGVMFLPSGLGYYNNSSSLPSYSNLIFSFKLYELRYRDHDRDKVLSKDEANPDPAVTDDYKRFYKYDTDGDGVMNMFDIDDDGDHVMTKIEIRYGVTTGTPPDEITNYFYYPFAGIPLCTGTGANGKKKHLDPSCQ